MEVKTHELINISTSAQEEFLNLLKQEKGPEGLSLRIGVEGGGCSGLSYVLGFDMAKEGDTVLERGELSVLVHPEHALYLEGLSIDFDKGLDNRGFMFTNPNASSSCGCGTSFAV